MTFDLLIGLLFFVGAIALTLTSYAAMRMLVGKTSDGRDRELAASVLTRIAAIHALLLALVFAQEMVDYQQLRIESALEANALADIYNDAARFDPASAGPIRLAIKDYLAAVVDKEWPDLAREQRLSASAWAAWDAVYGHALDMKTDNARQEALRNHMLDSVHVISEQRVKRESNGQDSLSSLFWFAGVIGVVFTAIAYYPYAPESRSILLLSMYGGFVGLVLFLIYAFSNPYSPPGALPPGAFLRLQAQIAGT